ncbi:MAG: hypothetical protein AB1631_23155, partial [Acidobacteriota bacterium]
MATDDLDKTVTESLTSAANSDWQGISPGTLLNGRYLIERELARGGIGVVYAARDQQLLSKRVVIKVLRDEMGQSDLGLWLQKKFRQEMEA